MFKSIATAALVVSFAGAAMAEDTFTTAKFLEWSKEGQRGYIVSSAMAAGLIAVENRKGQAQCIDKWVADNHSTGFTPVIEAMKKHSQYHPSAIIITLLEKECGSFKYASTLAVSP